MSKSTTPPADSEALVQLNSETTIDQLNAYLATIPTVEEDPTESMLQAVLAAASPLEWESVFTAQSFKDSDKARIQINAYRVSPSQFEGDLKHFLVLDVTDVKSGGKGVMTCGSTMAIAQILNAERTVGLPIQVEVVRKDKPTKNGFHPMRLRFIGSKGTPLGDPHAVVAEQ